MEVGDRTVTREPAVVHKTVGRASLMGELMGSASIPRSLCPHLGVGVAEEGERIPMSCFDLMQFRGCQ